MANFRHQHSPQVPVRFALFRLGSIRSRRGLEDIPHPGKFTVNKHYNLFLAHPITLRSQKQSLATVKHQLDSQHSTGWLSSTKVLMHADVLSNNAKWSVAILSWIAGVLHFTPVVLTHQWCHVGCATLCTGQCPAQQLKVCRTENPALQVHRVRSLCKHALLQHCT